MGVWDHKFNSILLNSSRLRIRNVLNTYWIELADGWSQNEPPPNGPCPPPSPAPPTINNNHHQQQQHHQPPPTANNRQQLPTIANNKITIAKLLQ
jgi:hypothetical protein